MYNEAKILPSSRNNSIYKNQNIDTTVIKTESQSVFHECVEEYSEDPQSYLKRSLGRDEEVLEQFDVYFPTHMIPRWKLVLYCISTLGLYLIILGYRSLLRLCYKYKCIAPLVYVLQRGKMVVTNKGRILVWEQNLFQSTYVDSCFRSFFKLLCCPRACAPPLVYEMHSNSKSFKIDSIRQISQFYSSSANCCCNGYESGVEISFNEYNHNGPIGVSSFVSTKPNIALISFLKRFQYWIDQSVTNRLEKWNNIFGLTHKSHVLYIVSNKSDSTKNGDVHALLDDVNKLYARVLSVLPKIEDKFILNSNISKGKSFKTDRFTGVIIVDNDMSISIPPKWFQLLQSEEVLNSIGLVYVMGALDYFYTCCTLGYYYWRTIQPKRFQRSAVVLTNKRVIVVDLNQSTGMVPSNLNDFEISVRCYIPGPIDCGYIYSSSFQHLETAISGLGGTIHIDFPTLPGMETRISYLPFAKSIQQVIRRVESKISPSDLENQIDNNDNKSNSIRISTITSEKEISTADYFRWVDEQLSSIDLEMIPFLDGESIIDVLRGLPRWEPFCNLFYWIYGSNCANNNAPINLCEKGKCCFPILPFFLTCGLRPFRYINDIIITNNTIFQYSRHQNDGIFGFNGPIAQAEPFFWPCDGSSMICQTNASFVIIWTPSDTINGHTVQYEYKGQDDWYSRLCLNYNIGKLCCPVKEAKYDLVIHAGDIDFLSSGKSKNTNWKSNPSLQETEKCLNNIEIINRN